MSSFETGNQAIRFRITGKQSIERLEPLMGRLFPNSLWCDSVNQPLDFVWETTCEKTHRESHANAKVLSRLHNTQVIESKANLAFLQESMDVPTVETYVTSDYSVILPWLQKRYENDNGWWVLKASHGNGGKDIWLINPSNYNEICSEITVNQEYVLQRY
jgi:glutathione synthase/RimK-type ligase-like ATP-grasp enzyme